MSEADDRRRLSAVYALFKKIELTGHLSSDLLSELRSELKSFADHPRLEISKLAAVADHLKSDMGLRSFVNFLVPVERALNKNIQDDDFLVSSEDRSTPLEARLPLRLVLDHFRSAFNVGSVLRSADGLGAEKVYLTGYTPTPESEKTGRASLGAETAVPWEKRESLSDLLRELKASGFRVVALETGEKAINLTSSFPKQPTAFVFGNERFGLDPSVLSLCDEVRILPLQGVKNSLNVGVVAALAMYEWKRQWSPA